MSQNHIMWEKLGMDVETHDLLCEALPQALVMSISLRKIVQKTWHITIWS